MAGYYDREGSPINGYRWSLLFHDPQYQILQQDGVGESYFISTVWIGLDHSFGRGDEPLIFETMVFKDGEDVDCKRHATESEALEFHNRTLNELRLIEAWHGEAGQEENSQAQAGNLGSDGSEDPEAA